MDKEKNIDLTEKFAALDQLRLIETLTIEALLGGTDDR